MTIIENPQRRSVPDAVQAQAFPVAPSASRTSTIDVIIPVYNEEADLARSVHRLDAYLRGECPYPYRITIADNASTDRTWEIAQQLCGALQTVQAVHLDMKGRGRALRQVWLESDADVVAYMDVDLSTDLRALLPLVAPLISGHSDLAIGTRLARGSRVVRGPKREFISRTYNLILKGTLGVSFSDAQCGFKAMRRDVARELLPLVEDNNWFFDTELLVLAQRAGLRIHEIPVDWTDDPGSTVHIVRTATEDLGGILRLVKGLSSGGIPVARLRAELANRDLPSMVPGVPRGMFGQVLRFAAVGVGSTIAYALLYLLLRGGMGAQAANLIALVLTAIANTTVNRVVTFGVRGRERMLRDQAGGLLAFAVGLGLTSSALWSLHHWGSVPSRWLELLVLFMANALATGFRFLALRRLMHSRSS